MRNFWDFGRNKLDNRALFLAVDLANTPENRDRAWRLLCLRVGSLNRGGLVCSS
jgi:hypothetical protein